MIEFTQTIFLAVVLAVLFVGFTVAYAYVCLQLKKLMDLVLSKRADRKIFKTVERARRDFA